MPRPNIPFLKCPEGDKINWIRDRHPIYSGVYAVARYHTKVPGRVIADLFYWSRETGWLGGTEPLAWGEVFLDDREVRKFDPQATEGQGND